MSNLSDVTERAITLTGFAPIMFDRYGGMNKKLSVEDKMYFLPDGKTVCLPQANISSFLSATNTVSVAKMIGGRGFRDLAAAFLSNVQISPQMIPITRNGVPIVFNGFVNGRDDVAGIYVDERVARLAKGIPNDKERPVIELPWELSFTLRWFKNTTFDEKQLQIAFERGGIAMGLGTFRGVFGKFTITKWE